MVPVIASNGGSFRGAFLYYCHDREARTTERVSWSQTVNMLTDCVTKAWKVMAYTAQHQDRLKEVSGQKATGAKLKKPVFAFSLSWAPEEKPEKSAMLEAAKRSLEILGLAEHQAIIVAHNDQAHRHVHIVANTVHPLTGLVAKLKHTKRKLSDFALQYERENGKIYCQRREENKREREQGKTTRHSDPHLQDAWDHTRTGKAFSAALEEKGYRLAQGRKRIVVVDPYGKTHNPTRLLKNVRAADLHARLADLDLRHLPDVAELDKAPVRHNPEPAPAKQGEETTEAQREPCAPIPETASANQSEAQQEQSQSPQTETSREESTADRNARKVEAMIERQREERNRFAEERSRLLRDTKTRLIDQYQLRERKQSLAALNTKIKEARWWQKLIGVTKKDKCRFEEQLHGYKNAVGQYRERIEALRQDSQQAVAMLDRTHRREHNSLTLAFRVQAERSKERDQENSRQCDGEKGIGRSHPERRRDDLSFER